MLQYATNQANYATLTTKTIAQWLQDEARSTASLRQHQQRQSAAAERRTDLFLAELEAYVPDAFEKQFCHPADLVEARALEMFQA